MTRILADLRHWMRDRRSTPWTRFSAPTGCCAGHALRASRLSACREKPEGLAGTVVPALVFPAVDLARAVALVFRAVGFQPINHFSFGQALGYLLGHALPRS
jgi:hypothetical protein